MKTNTYVWLDGGKVVARGEGEHPQDAFTRLSKEDREPVTHAERCAIVVPTTYEHFDKYRELANKLGIDALVSIVGRVASKEEIEESLAHTNAYALNSIPLHKWDRQDAAVRELARHVKWGSPGQTFSWSLADTVCVLKHVAIYIVAGAHFEGACTLCGARFEKYEAEHKRGDAICKECMAK